MGDNVPVIFLNSKWTNNVITNGLFYNQFLNFKGIMSFLYVGSEKHSLVRYKRERILFPSGSVNM